MADIISKSGDISLNDVHPTRTAGKRDLGKETNFISCKQCGFLFDKTKHGKGSGWGNETTASITTIGGTVANAKDPSVGPGCPFCGASEYD